MSTPAAHPASPLSLLTPIPLEDYELGVQDDPPPGHRVRVVAVAGIAGVLFGLLAWRDVATRHVGGGLPLGFGRLADLAEAHHWPGAWVVSALELAHFAGLFLLMAGAAWFGATRRPHALVGEVVIFHRRQSAWVGANPILLSLVALLAAHGVAQAGWPWLSGLIEIGALSVLCTAIWVCVVPEARASLSVIVDSNAGWSNRVVVAGGVRRLRGRLTIPKERLIDTAPRDIGGIEFLLGVRTLLLDHVDTYGVRQTLRLRGLADDETLGNLTAFLNGRFGLGVSREAIDKTTQLNRLPVEALLTLQRPGAALKP